jgi:poly-gamma-glutamate capsule biosynthesis protein CapA/YwtB (metallophosphatase superfamily)
LSYASTTGNFRIALGGDCMPTRRLSVYDEPEYAALVSEFRDADAGFVNLETVVRHEDEGTPGIGKGTPMTTPPALLADLQWFGINLVGCANNHAYDHGEGGLLATIKHLEAAGLVHAGSGKNLAYARMPGYVDTRAGRVGLVALSATFSPWTAAGAQRGDAQGRPGINPLGSRTSFRVDGTAFEALQRTSRELGFDKQRARNRTHFYSASEAPPERAEELALFGQHFIKGDDFAGTSVASAEDVAGNLRAISEARRMADWVVVSVHSHEFAQRSVAQAENRVALSEPADFIPEFARAAIDAGADVVVGHGSHTPLGIEIYKGRPIFYSLGNFVFENETVQTFPADAYTRFGLGQDATPADFLDERSANGKKGHVAQAGFWESVAVTCQFSDHRLTRIRLLPLDLGHGKSRSERGRPILAGPEMAARVLDRVDRLSQPYGVRVRTEGTTGFIDA